MTITNPHLREAYEDALCHPAYSPFYRCAKLADAIGDAAFAAAKDLGLNLNGADPMENLVNEAFRIACDSNGLTWTHLCEGWGPTDE